MAWIELHDTLPDHDKIISVSEALNMDKDLVVGKLVRLWTWALNNREDGTFKARDISTIAEVMRYKGKPIRLVDALVNARLLDYAEDTYVIHDWDERVGMLLDRREHQREYSKRKNALYSDMRLTKAVRKRDGDVCQYCGKTVNWQDRRGIDGGTYDHIDPAGINDISNLVVACRSCNSSKKNRTPEEATMTFIPTASIRQVYGSNTAEIRHEIPAITVPNRTVPLATGATLPNNSNVPEAPAELRELRSAREGAAAAADRGIGLGPDDGEPPQPNCFVVYEQNIGRLSPLVTDAITDYLDNGVEDAVVSAAIRAAVEHNAFTLGYVKTILDRCVMDGTKTLSAFEADQRRRKGGNARASPSPHKRDRPKEPGIMFD